MLKPKNKRKRKNIHHYHRYIFCFLIQTTAFESAFVNIDAKGGLYLFPELQRS